MSSLWSMPNSQKERSKRVLACVLCSSRKVKCDRKFPCVNCTKARVQCVPVKPASRQRRAGQLVLERLRTYEGLLQKNNIQFEPFQHEQVLESKSTHEHLDNHDPERSAQSSSPAASHSKNEAAIPSKNIWQFMSHGSPAPESDEESPNDGVTGSTIKSAWEEEFEHHSFLLLGSHKTAVDLESLHPEPVQIFRLWQTYLDNVNPLVKVIHAPSMQTKIIDAVSNLKGIDHAFEALMFSIYCMSITSFTVEECQTKFNSSKDELLARYEYGCQQALLNSGYLRSANRICLTALYLYLVSTGSRTDPRSLSSILGVATRIAQRMGIHNESILAKHTPFEAEMRRRLWWALVRLDSRIGEMADYKITSSTGTWNCKVPCNVNDSDLRSDMKEPPVSQDVPTEAVFVVVCSELSKSISQTKLRSGFTSPTSSQFPVSTSNELSQLEQRIDDIYLKSCLMENPLHYMTMWTTRARIAKYRLIEHYAKFLSASTSSMQQTDEARDAAITYAFTILDCDTKIASSPLTKGYTWVSHFYFPFPAYVHVVQDMKKRPLSKHAAKAWELMSENCEARFTEVPKSGFALVRMFFKVIMPGWEARAAALRESGEHVVVPRIISLIRYYLAQDVKASTTSEGPSCCPAVNSDNLLSSMPVDFETESLFYNIGPYDYSAPAPGLYPGTTAQGSDFTQDQINWTVMDWNASQSLLRN